MKCFEWASSKSLLIFFISKKHRKYVLALKKISVSYAFKDLCIVLYFESNKASVSYITNFTLLL